MPNRATILHADLDAFFASVEQRDDPKLRDRPLIVGQGVVLACSYEAKRRGVRSGMNASRARILCPDAITVPARMKAYSEASSAVFEQFNEFTPFVEPLSVDEAFLEVAGAEHIFGPAAAIAKQLKVQVQKKVGLTISVGVAQTKSLAKIASNLAKPNGIIVVDPDKETAFLHPLPIEVLWGVGPATAKKLHNHGIDSVGDLASRKQNELKAYLGDHASRRLLALAHNHDFRPVDSTRKDRSIGAQKALGNAAQQSRELRVEMLALTEKAAGRLRKANLVARTLTVRYRTSDMRQLSRSRTLPQATQQTTVLTTCADELLLEMIDGPQGPGSGLARLGCTLIGVTFSALRSPDAVQLALPLGSADKPTDALDDMVDNIRARWGKKAVARASLLEHKPAIDSLSRPTALDAAQQHRSAEPETIKK